MMLSKERVAKIRTQLRWDDAPSFELADTCHALYEERARLRGALEAFLAAGRPSPAGTVYGLERLDAAVDNARAALKETAAPSD